MNKKNVIIGIGSVLFGAFFLAFAFAIPRVQASSSSPTLFPKLISALMVLMGVLLLLREYISSRGGEKKKEEIHFKNGKYILIFAGSIVLYAVLLNFLGFIICTFLFLACLTYVLNHEKSWRSVLIAVIYGAVFTVALYFMFERLFNATLPVGSLFRG